MVCVLPLPAGQVGKDDSEPLARRGSRKFRVRQPEGSPAGPAVTLEPAWPGRAA
jgi:hypothetical protein